MSIDLIAAEVPTGSIGIFIVPTPATDEAEEGYAFVSRSFLGVDIDIENNDSHLFMTQLARALMKVGSENPFYLINLASDPEVDKLLETEVQGNA